MPALMSTRSVALWSGARSVALSSGTRRGKDRSPGHGEQGFTLIELLVVIAILGLLISRVAPAVLRQLGGAKVSIARQSIERMGSILDTYKLDVGNYPTTEDGLQALVNRPSDAEAWHGPDVKVH